MPRQPKSRLPALQRWDRVMVSLAIAGITALAWWYLIDRSASMMAINNLLPGADTGHLAGVQNTAIQPWTLQTFGMMLLMWVIMMVGMMLPSAVRVIMIFARVVQQTRLSTFLATMFFISGYLLAWTLFSLAATFFQWWLNQHALLSPTLVSSSELLGASLLIAAGIYQLTPIKVTCLKHCQSPYSFIIEHIKKDYSGASQLGLEYGFYCLGCCWVLMGLLFLAGVMNLLWILTITLYILLEKLLPGARYTSKVSGALMIITGLILFA